MFRCPHCEKKGISPLRKIIMSPGLLAECNACHQPSTLRYASWLLGMLPGSILMLVAFFVESESLEWWLNGVGLGLMIVVPFLFAPLFKETE